MLSLTSRFTIARNARLRTTIRACQHATIATTTRRCDALPLSDAQRRTIYALSTPPGKSGVALIRVSGPEALSVWERMVRSTRGARDKGDQGTKPSPRLPEPWKMQRCHILDPHSSDTLDEALAVFFRGAPGTSQKSSTLPLTNGPVDACITHSPTLVHNRGRVGITRAWRARSRRRGPCCPRTHPRVPPRRCGRVHASRVRGWSA